MIQIINKDVVKLTNSGVTITKSQYDELDELMRDGWYYMALRFVQVSYDTYRDLNASFNRTGDFDTTSISIYAKSHYSDALQHHIQSLVNAQVYTTMRDAIADSIGYDQLSGIATLAWEMEFDDDDDVFYHDMLMCSFWIE